MFMIRTWNPMAIGRRSQSLLLREGMRKPLFQCTTPAFAWCDEKNGQILEFKPGTSE